MKLLVDVKDSKADFVVELLNSLPFIKTKQLSPSKSQKVKPSKKEILQGISRGLKEVKLIEEGKMKSRPAKEFLREL